MTRKEIERQLVIVEAALIARDAAAQTPPEVRRAFLSRNRKVGPVTLHQLCLGMLFIWEELQHPFHKRGKGTLSVRDAARAIFAFASPEEAGVALANGVESYDAGARAIARKIGARWLGPIILSMAELFMAGMDTAPGAGSAPKIKAGKDGSPQWEGVPKTSGIGWTLTILEALLSAHPYPSYVFNGEHRGPEDWVIWRLPLARAFALYVAMATREGGEFKGVTYQEKAMIRAKEKARAALPKEE
jgi:hypothetical protein